MGCAAADVCGLTQVTSTDAASSLRSVDAARPAVGATGPGALARAPVPTMTFMLAALLSFIVTATLIVLLPGPDTLVVLRGVVRGGRGEAFRTAAGIVCGLMVWVTAAVLGLSALLQASETGYEILKIVGACYLVWMGISSVRAMLRAAPDLAASHDVVEPPAGRKAGLLFSGFTAGLLTNILNPKIGILFISLLPGFVPDGYSTGWTTLGLGAIYIALTAAYFTVLVGAAGRIAGWLQSARIRRRVEAIGGVALIGLGVRLALEG